MASTTVGDSQRLHMAVPIKQPYIWPYLTNWLGGYPLKVEIRFRIPLGLRRKLQQQLKVLEPPFLSPVVL